MGKKYKVILDRNLCIGAAACEIAAPNLWEIDKEDGKANLKGGSKVDGKHETFEIIIDEKDYKVAKDSAEVCPVAGCIKVVEIEE
jgi:ferredoxin